MTDTADEVSALYRRTCRQLIGLLRSLGAAHADAEEIAHDAYVKLIRHWDRLSRYDVPEAWLRTVAVRDLISRQRRDRVRVRALRKQIASSTEPVAGPIPDRVALEAALQQLTMAHRAVLVLHHGVGLSIDEVAEMLNVRPGTVKSRLARARDAIAPFLADEEVASHE
jgi:RNA polymerase sigma-70 factor (ECF subfamily)